MKSWKNWPYWLKGGVIGGGVTVLSALLIYSCQFVTSGDSELGCGLLFFVFSPIFPVAGLGDYFVATFNVPRSFEILVIASVVVWFIIGALIGALVGYVKSTRRDSTHQNPS